MSDITPPQPPMLPTMPPPAAAPARGRFRTGLHLLGISWGVVKSEPSLLVLPILSMLAGLALLAGFAGIFWANGTISRVADTASTAAATGAASNSMTPVDYALMAVYYFLAAFLVTFFNAAIVAVAMKRLSGEDATVGDGLRMAAKHAGKIALWALITAAVGLIMRALRERSGIIGTIIISIIGVAWTLITFFVVPVLLFEDVGAVGSIKRSASIFKQKWGEQVAGSIAITGIFAIIAFLGILVGGGLVTVQPVLGVVFIVLVIVAISAASGAVSGVFNTALYRYATTGEAGVGFTESDLASAFYAKKSKR